MAAPQENPLEVYAKGTKAWFADEEEGWIQGTLKDKSVLPAGVKMVFSVDSRGKDIVFESPMNKLVASKFADLPPLKNPPMLEGIDDLSNLSYLHEPAVLHNIRLRYLQEQIYTYSGIVLIAMNPFQRLALYTPDIMREYSGKRRGELEPHLFAVAEEAYRTMIRDKKNQSIIVSGESGAGKTQSAKYIMRYFAIVDDLEKKTSPAAADGAGGTTEIEEAVLSTNPIMESFGNSKTTRNDNSSRFGKYIEILFSKPSGPNNSVRITGATIRTYLLERSRLIFQPATERNYHIFYQLCAAVPAAERKEWELGRWNDYHYLNQGGTGTIPGCDDAAEFAITQQALSTIGIPVATQWDIFKICAALLHIGNIKLTSVRDEAQVSDDDAALQAAARLLGLPRAAELKKWIVKKQIVTRSEKIVTALGLYHATVGRDSVAKFIYCKLFDWLVRVVNNNLSRGGAEAAQSFIGVLDIYGFEHFKKNSFEQFCINYANEKLQQEFNQHVFKLEQEEYVAEKINWSFIDFNDNQPCIDMIENKLGILDLLDEESRLPSGSDASLITKLYQRFGTPQARFFEKPRFGQKAFTIKHYATDVTYEIEGFIEKNKDTVSDEQLAVLNAGNFAFLKEVISTEEEAPAVETKPSNARGGGGGAGQSKKPTLGAIFKASLVKLMATLRTTEVHYIRCIKPNQTKTAFGFEPQMVLAQLRACGVLETIRISCAGYPSRWTYQEFADRYYLLVPSAQWTTDARALTARVVQAAIARADLYQQGTTKIFFRAGQLALLERLRSERLRECVVCIQKNIRRLITRKRYLRMRAAAIKIQTAWRAYRARELFRAERERLAAIKIQKYARRWLAMKRLRKSREAAVRIQTVYRMHRARAELDDLRRYRAAVRIQKLFRGFLARRWYRLTIRQIVLLQSCVRRRRAMRELRVLKTEARSVGKLKELNYKLENKVVELSQALKARDEEVRALTDKVGSLESHVGSWKDKFSRADSSSRAANAQLNEGSTEMRADLKAAVEARDAFQRDAERATAAGAKKDAEIEALKQELARSRDDVRRLREEAKSAAPPPPKLDDAAAAAALRKEVASLREQMSRLIAGKWTRDRVADSLLQAAEGSGGYAFAGERPAPGSAAAAAASAAAAAAAAAAASAGQPYWTHGQADQLGAEAAIAARPRPPSAADIAVPPPEMFSAGRNSAASRRSTASSRASSYASYASSGLESALTYTNGADERAIEAERAVRALEDKALEDEILDGLIANLRIPLPSTQTVATRREIFFPAHLVGAVMQQQLRHDLAARLQQLTGSVLRAVRALTMKFEDDYVSAFWLSNCFELLAVVRLLQEREARRAAARATAMTKAAEAAAAGPRYGGVSGAAAYGGVGAYSGGAGGFGGLPLPDLNEGARTLDKVRDELDGLAVAIYRGWIKELKKRLGNMVVPAVIENQSLPGYVCKQSGGLWGRWGGGGGSKGAGGSSSAFTIEQLLNFLSKLSKTMRCYYMDEAMTRQILTELLRVIGVSAFNHLLMRKNFCTWKRGVQIQYNVSRLEEWCASHGVGEATLHLQQLLQAGKLLTLNKTSPQDLETVFDVCFLLNATQVKKLLSLYYAADFDSPLSPELLRSVASRAVVNEKQDALLLDLDAGEPDVAVAPATAAVAIDPFVPAWVSLPRLSAVVAATAPPQPPQPAGEIEA